MKLSRLILIPIATATLIARAQAAIVIGVEDWTAAAGAEQPAGALDPAKAAAGASSFVESEIFRLLNEDADFKSCPAKLTEMARREELKKEQQLQHGPLGDPATAVAKGQVLAPTHLIKGTVAPTANGGGEYSVQIIDARTGKPKVAFAGELGRDGDYVERISELARDILKNLCVPPAVQVKAAYNDLKINQKVCDITKPFTLTGTGKTAGIRFNMIPGGAEGGSFTVGGTAAGVPWSGGGTYTVSLAQGSGKIAISGSWKITTPYGVFGDTGTIPGTVTALEQPCK